MSKIIKGRVVKSPWPDRLPDGTIVTTFDGDWFEREDGLRLFPAGRDKSYDSTLKFKLFNGEWERIDQ